MNKIEKAIQYAADRLDIPFQRVNDLISSYHLDDDDIIFICYKDLIDYCVGYDHDYKKNRHCENIHLGVFSARLGKRNEFLRMHVCRKCNSDIQQARKTRKIKGSVPKKTSAIINKCLWHDCAEPVAVIYKDGRDLYCRHHAIDANEEPICVSIYTAKRYDNMIYNTSIPNLTTEDKRKIRKAHREICNVDDPMSLMRSIIDETAYNKKRLEKYKNDE